MVLVHDAAKGRSPELPWAALEPGTDLGGAGARLVRTSLGEKPAWIGSLGAYGEGEPHPGGRALSVAFVAIVRAGTVAPDGYSWVDAEGRIAIGRRQRRMVTDAVAALRDRMDLVPVAFLLLPARFTLSQAQGAYEVLLGRRLHKASFRRALLGASLIVATDEWTSEGRGRPARFYRYAPSKRTPPVRPIRFEMLG